METRDIFTQLQAAENARAFFETFEDTPNYERYITPSMYLSVYRDDQKVFSLSLKILGDEICFADALENKGGFYYAIGVYAEEDIKWYAGSAKGEEQEAASIDGKTVTPEEAFEAWKHITLQALYVQIPPSEREEHQLSLD